MVGFAQKLYSELSGKNASLFRSSRQNNTPWPFLNTLLAKKQLSYVDYALAEKLLHFDLTNNESTAAFLCFLSMAARQGHLCIKINENQILPQPIQVLEETLVNDEGLLAVNEEIDLFISKVIEGSQRIPDFLLSNVNHQLEGPLNPICRFNHSFYFQKYWVEEALFLKHFNRLLNSNVLQMDSIKVEAKLVEMMELKHLLPEQAEAIRKFLMHSLSILSGGPGTGKTYTAGRMIEVLWECMSNEQRLKTEIVLVAPTGKAAANLQASLNRFVGKLENFKPLTAKTLHSVLGWSSKQPKYPFLSADLIIVDESSMIDVKMMAKLFSSVKEGSRLVMLGDRHQLPPIEAGSIFSDMIQFCESKRFPIVTELSTCLRAELQSIVSFAQDIKDKNIRNVLNAFETKNQGITRVCFPNDESSQQSIVDHAAKYFNKYLNSQLPPEQLLESLKSFCLLSPLRKGPFGVDALNRYLITDLLKKQKRRGSFVVPIMITRNEPLRDLFNGDMGLLVINDSDRLKDHLQLQLSEEDFVLFIQKDPLNANLGPRRLPALLLSHYELAFCMSVYKSQGSEFDYVFLVLPEGSDIFGKEMFYTAATRAKKELQIWGSDRVLGALISREGRRLSGVNRS